MEPCEIESYEIIVFHCFIICVDYVQMHLCTVCLFLNKNVFIPFVNLRLILLDFQTLHRQVFSLKASN